MNKLTERQIAWASQHDWFVRRTEDEQTIVVADRYSDGTETIERWTGTFAELRAWAGY